MVELHHKSRNQLINETFTFGGFFIMSGILFLVRKFCNVEIMPMVVVGRWRHKGGPHEPHPIFIFQTIFISNLITMIKKGNLGNQWQSLISTPQTLSHYLPKILSGSQFWFHFATSMPAVFLISKVATSLPEIFVCCYCISGAIITWSSSHRPCKNKEVAKKTKK